ncbi:MAG: HDOD domain-containing protein, partial [Pseudomonadales bacterium]|nr:HDOD domain-containing protein [Pseudomonadales bacterium]
QKEKKFDVIVSDMRMPNMNGAELLEKVRLESPDTIRIALSGYADAEMTLESVHATHQFIAKPAEAEKVTSTIVRALATREWLGNAEISELLGSIESLPVLPHIYDELMQEIASEDCSIKRVADIVAGDVALSALLLKIVNSAFFGLVRHIESSQQAAGVLGVETIKNLALLTCVFDSFGGDDAAKAKLQEVNSLSQKVGMLAFKIARASSLEGRAVDHTQIAGMMSGLGDLIVARYADTFSPEQHPDLENPLVGSYLLSIWNMPFAVVEAVRWHQKPGDSGINELSPLAVLHAAWAIVKSHNAHGEVAFSEDFADLAYLNDVAGADAVNEWLEIGSKFIEAGSE